MSDKIRVFTAFSGYDSQCLALNRLKEKFPGGFDYELVGWSEIDESAIKAHNILFPDAKDKNYGDISKVDWNDVPDFDLFTYSSPCFVAGTYVLVKKNKYDECPDVVAIENVQVGDLVMTHTGEYKKVLEVMKNTYNGVLYTLYGSWGDEVTCTPDHLFYCYTDDDKEKCDWVSAKDIQLGFHHPVTAVKDKWTGEYYLERYPHFWKIEIELSGRDIFVYNLEVEDNHSYTANNFVVHNCTSISLAGKREGLAEGSGTSSSLLWECRRCIEAKRPKYLLFENVSAILSPKFMPYFQKWISTVRNFGYANFWSVLNAKDYGIPQNRERVFMVSIRQDDEDTISYNFPNPITPRTCKAEDLFEDNVSEDYYINQEKVDEWAVDNEDRIKDYIATRNDIERESLE